MYHKPTTWWHQRRLTISIMCKFIKEWVHKKLNMNATCNWKSEQFSQLVLGWNRPWWDSESEEQEMRRTEEWNSVRGSMYGVWQSVCLRSGSNWKELIRLNKRTQIHSQDRQHQEWDVVHLLKSDCPVDWTSAKVMKPAPVEEEDAKRPYKLKDKWTPQT